MVDRSKDDYYGPPPKRSAREQIFTFLWNSETKQFMGRTGSSWAKILIFYVIFYIVLSIFWGTLWIIFDKIAIRPDQPRWTLKESLIGNNPGLGFRPMPKDDYVDSSLIWFKTSNNGFVNWTTDIKNFLEPYSKAPRQLEMSRNVIDCNYNSERPRDKVCKFPLEDLRPCDPPFYNYDRGTPCIFLKLNKIYEWVPEYYNNTNDLPVTMPKDLRDKITQRAKNSDSLNFVWISCEGENAADKEHIGIINMSPNFGFAGYYFPYLNNPGYLSPLVAVWFTNPKRGVLINIECKAWAKNIIYDRHDRRGSVHFEIMIDD